MELSNKTERSMQEHRSEAIVIGWINVGRPADCGETMKNQLMIQKLESLGVKCRAIDFKNWKKHPWVFLQLLWDLLIHRDNSIIFSTSAQNVYPMMKLMYRIGWKQHCIHWVIGGTLGDNIVAGRMDAKVLGYMNWTIVESNKMVQQLNENGVENVIQLPNFKPITYYPDIKKRLEERKENAKKPLRFVFLSRIMPEKGCDYIIEAARCLNKEGYEERYCIDFYGKIADTYKSVFEEKLKDIGNVSYKGFLNLRESAGYDLLADYDMMLFPTYWKGEGFAGVFIDAFVCGLPILISDWAHNRQFMQDKDTAVFVPVHNVIALKEAMADCINGVYDITDMAIRAQKKAEEYNVDNVITVELLRKIGLTNK